MLREQLEVYPRLVVVALEEALRDQRDQIAVSDEIGCEQRDVRLLARRPIEATARRNVRLTTQDRREPELARGVVKLHRAVHHAVIRQRHGLRPFFRRLPAQAVDAARSVEKRILRMDVQMDELTHVNAFYGMPRTISSRVQ